MKLYYTELGIFSSTIKNNILFGKDYDDKLFQRVIHASALEDVCPLTYVRIMFTNTCS
jgi:ABC-type multidrug transport system fused ATPase/permease subunit